MKIMQQMQNSIATLSILILAGAHLVHGQNIRIISDTAEISKYKPCSREYIHGVDGYWTPTTKQLNEAYWEMRALIEKTGNTDPSSYHTSIYSYQAFGIVSAGDSLIYFNAAPLYHRINKLKRLFDVCDGGSIYWGVFFNMRTKAITAYSRNGEA